MGFEKLEISLEQSRAKNEGVIGMHFGCTRALLKEAGIRADERFEKRDLFSWSVHVIPFKKKKAIVAVNDSNRYGFILFGLKPSDFENLQDLLMEGIENSLKDAHIRPDVIERYFEDAGEPYLSKTRGPGPVARLNNSGEFVKDFSDAFERKSLYQWNFSHHMNLRYIGVPNQPSQFTIPRDLLIQDFESSYSKPVISCPFVKIQVDLDLERYVARRILQVPYRVSFSFLHRVLVQAFGWKDYHLHEFEVTDSKGQGHMIVMELDFDDESMRRPGFLYHNETQTMLSDFMKESKTFKYTYDFGDYWVHTVTVLTEPFDLDIDYPICLEAEGQTPPEDVGGVGGFLNFLDITADPDHEEYQEWVDWAEGMYYRPFHLSSINRILKHHR